MADRTPLSQVEDKPPPPRVSVEIDPVAEEAKKTPPDIAGQTPPLGELSSFTDMRDLSIQLGFEDTKFDGMGKEADILYNWAKRATGTTGGPETLLRVKYLIQDLGINSRGRDLLRRVSQWASLDTSVKDINIRKAAV